MEGRFCDCRSELGGVWRSWSLVITANLREEQGIEFCCSGMCNRVVGQLILLSPTRLIESHGRLTKDPTVG